MKSVLFIKLLLSCYSRVVKGIIRGEPFYSKNNYFTQGELILKIIINVGKKHLAIFSLFLILLTGIFVLATDSNPTNNPGHSADDIGSGTITGHLTIDSDGNYAPETSVLYVDNTGENSAANAIVTEGDFWIKADEESDGIPKLILGEGGNSVNFKLINGVLTINSYLDYYPYDEFIMACLDVNGWHVGECITTATGTCTGTFACEDINTWEEEGLWYDDYVEFPITCHEISIGNYTTGLNGCSCTDRWGCHDDGWGEFCQNGGFAGWSSDDSCNEFQCGDCGCRVAINPICICEGDHASPETFLTEEECYLNGYTWIEV
jgi:hypothetical protein